MHLRTTVGICGLAASLMLTGCKVGPDYVAPRTDVPQSFAHLEPGGRTSPKERAIEIAWWRTLQDATLDDLVARAVVGNLDHKLAVARLREARAARGIVAADALPQVDVNVQANRARQSANTRQGNFVGGEASNLFQGGFDATWELDLFGRVARTVEAADADIQAAEESRRNAIVSLVSEVARNYVELRGFQQRLAIANKNIALQRDTLELAKSRFQAGLTSDLDVAQAESSLASVQAQVPSLERGVQASIHRLSVLLGTPPVTLRTELEQAASLPVPPEEVPVGLPSELLLRRPDIRQAEREVAAANARIAAARADLFPRFSLTGSFGLAADKIPSVPDASSRFWSFGPAMRWPILDWGRIRSNIAVQDARTEQALIRYESVVLTSFEDVENALVSLNREQERRRSLLEAVTANQRAIDLANQLYSSGITDFQRVLDSQRALFASEDALVESNRSVVANLIALYKALGGGWEAWTPSPAVTTVGAAAETPKP